MQQLPWRKLCANSQLKGNWIFREATLHNNYSPGKCNQKKTQHQRKGTNSRQNINTTCTNFNKSIKPIPVLTPRKVSLPDLDCYMHGLSTPLSDLFVYVEDTDYPRPMGLAGIHGVPTWAHPYPTPGQTESQNRWSKSHKKSKRWLAKRAIVKAQHLPTQFCLPNLPGRKKGEGQRPVINLKGLNSFVKMEHFKMEGLHILPDIIQQADWMVQLDLKDIQCIVIQT